MRAAPIVKVQHDTATADQRSAALSELTFGRLTAPETPLLEKFYRLHRSKMRVARPGTCWVARGRQIVGGLNLREVDGGLWLTGLLVAPDWRHHGIGRALVNAACSGLPTPVWLFCDPTLERFYRRAGFNPTEALPSELTTRLERYRSTKPLVALIRPSSQGTLA